MPFIRERYSTDWEEISKRIRERDSQKCKWCGIDNYTTGYRDEKGDFHKASIADESVLLDGYKLIRIVLTVAHVNHDPTDNRDENLAALCQKCHLTHDAKMHARAAAVTRRRKVREQGQLELWEDAT